MPNEPEFGSEEWCDRLIDRMGDDIDLENMAGWRALIRAAIEETRKHDADKRARQAEAVLIRDYQPGPPAQAKYGPDWYGPEED